MDFKGKSNLGTRNHMGKGSEVAKDRKEGRQDLENKTVALDVN